MMRFLMTRYIFIIKKIKAGINIIGVLQEEYIINVLFKFVRMSTEINTNCDSYIWFAILYQIHTQCGYCDV